MPASDGSRSIVVALDLRVHEAFTEHIYSTARRCRDCQRVRHAGRPLLFLSFRGRLSAVVDDRCVLRPLTSPPAAWQPATRRSTTRSPQTAQAQDAEPAPTPTACRPARHGREASSRADARRSRPVLPSESSGGEPAFTHASLIRSRRSARLCEARICRLWKRPGSGARAVSQSLGKDGVMVPEPSKATGSFQGAPRGGSFVRPPNWGIPEKDPGAAGHQPTTSAPTTSPAVFLFKRMSDGAAGSGTMPSGSDHCGSPLALQDAAAPDLRGEERQSQFECRPSGDRDVEVEFDGAGVE